MWINSMVGIFSQCLHLLNHHTEPFKYITILFVNYTLIKMKAIKRYYTYFLYLETPWKQVAVMWMGLRQTDSQIIFMKTLAKNHMFSVIFSKSHGAKEVHSRFFHPWPAVNDLCSEVWAWSKSINRWKGGRSGLNMWNQRASVFCLKPSRCCRCMYAMSFLEA